MFLSVVGKKKTKQNSPPSGGLPCLWNLFLKEEKFGSSVWVTQVVTLGASAVKAGSSRWRRRARVWPPERRSPLKWSEQSRLRGKRGKNDDWITIARLFVSGRECRRSLVWGTFSFLNSAGHVPAREITIFGGGVGGTGLVTMWERPANTYCWLGPVLFSGVLLCLYIRVFSIIPLFFVLSGVGFKGRGWVLFPKRQEVKE